MPNPTERERQAAAPAGGPIPGATGASDPPGASGKPGASAGAAVESPGEAFRAVGLLFQELKAYFVYYLRARVHGVKLSVRNAAIYAALGILGAIAGGTAIVVATAFLIAGVCHFINFVFALASPRLTPWAGELVTGLLLLGGIAGGAWFAIRRYFETSRHNTVQQDERQRHEQWVKYGHDVHDRAKHG